jgi:hypothetical protein
VMRLFSRTSDLALFLAMSIVAALKAQCPSLMVTCIPSISLYDAMCQSHVPSESVIAPMTGTKYFLHQWTLDTQQTSVRHPVIDEVGSLQKTKPKLKIYLLIALWVVSTLSLHANPFLVLLPATVVFISNAKEYDVPLTPHANSFLILRPATVVFISNAKEYDMPLTPHANSFLILRPATIVFISNAKEYDVPLTPQKSHSLSVSLPRTQTLLILSQHSFTSPTPTIHHTSSKAEMQTKTCPAKKVLPPPPPPPPFHSLSTLLSFPISPSSSPNPQISLIPLTTPQAPKPSEPAPT